MKLLVINNLKSGYGEGAVYDFIRSFVGDGDEVCMRATDGSTEVATMLYDAASFDAVIASGGDGTVAAVSYVLAGTGIPVLPFPAGTANLLALNLHSPNEPHALAKMVKSGLTLDFDLGEIEVNGTKLGFVIMAGAGYDAAIMRDAKPHKRVWGPMAYFSAALANATPQKSKFRLVIDGKPVESEGLGILLVNFAKLQFDLSVTHENEPRDGELGVVVLKGKSAFDLIPALIGMVLDRDGAHPDRTDSLEIYTCKEMSVEAEPPMEVQFDGETTAFTTPFSARILPGAARYYVSEEGYEQFSNAPRSDL